MRGNPRLVDRTTFSSSTFQVHPSNLWHPLGSDACAGLLLRLFQRLLEVADEVIRVLDAHGKTQQGVVDPEAVQGLRGNVGVGLELGVGDERLDAAEAF